jgi:hypothetical protein
MGPRYGRNMVQKRNTPVYAGNRTLTIQPIASHFDTQLPGLLILLTVTKSVMRKAEIRDVRFSWQ